MQPDRRNAEGVIVDHQGRPCPVAAAIERFAEPIEEARKLSRLDLVRSIARAMSDISARQEVVFEAVELAADALPNSTDSDAARAVLTMAKAYDLQTSTQWWDFTGFVLLALAELKDVEPGVDAVLGQLRAEVDHAAG